MGGFDVVRVWLNVRFAVRGFNGDRFFDLGPISERSGRTAVASWCFRMAPSSSAPQSAPGSGLTSIRFASRCGSNDGPF